MENNLIRICTACSLIICLNLLVGCNQEDDVWQPLVEFRVLESKIEESCFLKPRVSTTFQGTGKKFKYVKVTFIEGISSLTCSNDDIKVIVDEFLSVNYNETGVDIYFEKYDGQNFQMYQLN